RAGPRAVEHAHGVQRHGFGDAVRRTADGARDVRSVPVAIIRAVAVIHGAECATRTTAELYVRRPNATVDDVDAHTGARGRVDVRPGDRHSTLGDPIESPRRAWLH